MTNESNTSVEPWLNALGSRYFLDWMQQHMYSLAFTTYQTDKLFLVGLREDQVLSVFERTFNRSMGCCAAADGRTLSMSSQYQLWRFENVFAEAAC